MSYGNGGKRMTKVFKFYPFEEQRPYGPNENMAWMQTLSSHEHKLYRIFLSVGWPVDRIRQYIEAHRGMIREAQGTDGGKGVME